MTLSIENNAPFIACISKIKNVLADHGVDLEL